MELITKIHNKNYKVDVANNRITFLDNRFYLSESGSYYPSATTILDAYPKGAAFFEWIKKYGEDSDQIRDDAGKRGSIVHDLTERYDDGEEINLIAEDGSIQVKMGEWAMLEKYVEFRTSHKTNVIENELSLVSDKLEFGGTIDRVMQVNGKLYLVDIKTSNYISNHYWLQLACYSELLKDCKGIEVEGIAILHLNAKTRTTGTKGAVQGKGWQLITCDDQREIAKYYRLFKATHSLWLEENGSMMPKEFFYKLKHKI